ncbi:DUF6531 domain-containing protein [Kitasatospora phosalacinea]|uniref:DUF6531 domain-containing protein n=1 Tax=Kitasatospora phosalacinea TaxID=2065 RepID=UPI00364AF91A
MSNQIVKALEHAAQKLGKTLAEDAGKALKGFYRKAGDNMKKVAKNVREVEEKHAKDLKKIMEGHDTEVPRPRAGGPGGRSPLGGPGRSGQRSEGNRLCLTKGDPVDVVSGQMITSETDLDLPGLLPLALRRSYASGYRAGQWFGPGWSSTLDQRVQQDAVGLHFAGDDAQLLHYPLPGSADQEVFPAHGARWPLTWDEASDTFRIEDTRTGRVRHFAPVPEPGAARPLSAITDRNGHRIDFFQDDAGLPTEVHHSGGYRIAVDVLHTSGGPRIEALRLLDGTNGGLGTTVVRYGYDPLGRLAEITDSSSVPLLLTHDSQDRIVSWTDRNAHTYRYDYGPDGRVVRGHGDGGALEAVFVYDDAKRVNTVTDGLGRCTRYHYDQDQHVTRTVTPDGRSTLTEYDHYGHLLAHTDPLGRTTRFALDANGDPIRVERPDGSILFAQYDRLRMPVRVEAADGSVWRYRYDGAGNRIEAVDPSGARTLFGYDAAGAPASVTDALGNTSLLRCDRAGLVVEAVDPCGSRTRYERDGWGRPVAVTDATGRTTRHTWTVEGLPLTRTARDGTTRSWTYDARGNNTSHLDPVGGETRMEYGPFGRLTATTGPDGARYGFTYNSDLQLTEVTDPLGRSWTYTHDSVGRVVSETDFNGRTVSYTHDAAGRLASRTNAAGQTVRFEYDTAGNLIAKDADGTVTRYAYDRADRLVHAAAPGVELTRSHDPLGRLLSETVNGRTVAYGYDPVGRLTSRRTPSGHTSTWTHDAAGRTTGLDASGQLVRFERDGLGRETTRQVGEALTLTSVWDELHRLTDRTLHVTGHSTPVQQSAYSYRADGHLLSMTDRTEGERRFDLDPAGRVTAVHAGDWTEEYRYDPVGNLTEASWPARNDLGQGPRTYRGTLLQSAGRLGFRHDAQGRVTRRSATTLSGKTQHWHFTWDAEDRLVSAVTPDGARWRYLYDPFGRRIAKQHLAEDGTDTVLERTDFVWDASTLIEQTAHSPQLPAPYTLSWEYQGLQPITQTERIGGPDESQQDVDRRFFAIVTDLVGAPTRLVGTDGDTVWQADVSLWGETRQRTGGATTTPLRFPGQYYDPETRLHYNVHRYYDPATARYLSPDPLGLVPSPNPHAYVVNPLLGADPLGLAEELPMGEKGNPFPSREAAERAAFDLAGIPYGTPPDERWEIGPDVQRRGMPGYVYETNPSHWGEMRQFETPQGSRLIIEHTGDTAGPHFHAGMPKGRGEDAMRTGVNFGWGGSDPVRDGFERYQKIDKPGGDHHLFYTKGDQCPG